MRVVASHRWPTPSAPTTGGSPCRATTRSSGAWTGSRHRSGAAGGHTPLPVRLPLSGTRRPSRWAATSRTPSVSLPAHDAFMSQHLGDMENLPSLDALARSVELLGDLYGIAPRLAATDLHPGYHTRRWARSLAADREMALVGVQHHHAHLAALMAEHGLTPRATTMIGIVFDGTGWGTDDTLWGGEVLVGSYAGRRAAGGHLRAGAAAGRRRRRPPSVAGRARAPPRRRHRRDGTARRRRAPRRTPPGSSGSSIDPSPARPPRAWVDSSMPVASLLGVRHHISYEAQAAIVELEHLAATGAGPPPISLAFRSRRRPHVRRRPGRAAGSRHTAGWAPIPVVWALAFHQSVATLCARIADAVRAADGLSTVGLTGGVFQNDLLTRLTTAALGERGFTVLTHRVVPANDGGLALGHGGGGPRTSPKRETADMCLGIPGCIIETRDVQGIVMATVDFGGVTKDVCLALPARRRHRRLRDRARRVRHHPSGRTGGRRGAGALGGDGRRGTRPGEVPRRVRRSRPGAPAVRRDRGRHHSAVVDHGGLWWPDPLDHPPRHRPAAARRDLPDPRPGLPGVRHAAGDHRPRPRDRPTARCRVLHVRRHAPRAGVDRRPRVGQSRRCRRAHRLLAPRRRGHRRHRTRTRRGVPRRRLRDHGTRERHGRPPGPPAGPSTTSRSW